MTSPRHERLLRDLADLKLHRIAEMYQEVLNEAARKGSFHAGGAGHIDRRRSRLPAVSGPWSSEFTAPGCPSERPSKSTTSTSPRRFPSRPSCGCSTATSSPSTAAPSLIGPTGTGKSHLLNALGYTACEKGISVRFTRVVDMINTLTTAQINGTLEKNAPAVHHPVNFSSSMNWAICPSTNAVRTCCSRSSPPGMNPARSWSPPTEPSGTGARSSMWTTPWPPP